MEVQEFLVVLVEVLVVVKDLEDQETHQVYLLAKETVEERVLVMQEVVAVELQQQVVMDHTQTLQIKVLVVMVVMVQLLQLQVLQLQELEVEVVEETQLMEEQ